MLGICTAVTQHLIHSRALAVIMPIKYFPASDVKDLTDQLIEELGFVHIPKERVICIRSVGSKSRGTIARVHSFPKVWQRGLAMKAHYAIEVISEHFDDLSMAEQEKVIIHELLHVPKCFGGGFRHHRDWVTRHRVDRLHAALVADRLRDSSNG
jgi:predicted metallopeptidase